MGSAVSYRLTSMLPSAETQYKGQDKLIALTFPVQLCFGEYNWNINSMALSLKETALHANGVCAQINSIAAALEVSLAREPMQTWDR